jgi:SAM-dependent methyltransferase
MKEQTSEICRQVKLGRLAYHHNEATPEFWESMWNSTMNPGYFQPYLKGNLDFYRAPFERYLPRRGRILEAGCGTGQYVVALRSRGYDCVGVDYAADTVSRVRAMLPDLPISVEDITAMTFPTESFSAVISLGVVEHRREGPEPYLREMRRVLVKGGRLLVSVPHFNSVRRFRARRGAYRRPCPDTAFYQWAFDPTEFREILAREGYSVVGEFDYNYQKCLLDEFAWLNRLPSVVYRGIIKGSGYLPGVRSRLGHMRMYIAEKLGGSSSEQGAGEA